MATIGQAALVGGGVIGAGWAARLALNGIPVRVYDPDPAASARIDATLARAARAYRRMTLVHRPDPAPVVVTTDLAAAVAEADLVQENGPERYDVKAEILAAVSAAARPDALIGSSTSGLLPTRLQRDVRHPERFVVAHPFNPVYLVPLVELCAGAETAPETVALAAEFFGDLGMHPLVVRTEIDGFIADRLMEALWREALHMVNDGVATADEIDQAICYGPGLRWAFMGSFLTYRLAGGAAGMRHFLEQFGPALELPWSRLEAPPLTPDLIDRIVAQSDAQAGAVTDAVLANWRDDCLVAILQALRACDYGAGRVLRDHERRLHDGAHTQTLVDDQVPEAPLRLLRSRVAPEWIDYNGHLTESRYLQVFGDASDALYRYVGADPAGNGGRFSYFTVETHIRHRREVGPGEPLTVSTQILGVDDKRLHLFHAMAHGTDGTELATAEQMMVHVDTASSRSCPAPPAVLARLKRIEQAHACLPPPDGAGRRIERRPAAMPTAAVAAPPDGGSAR